MAELGARLEAVIRERLAVARATTDGRSGGTWKNNGPYDSWLITDDDGDVVVYGEGSPSEAQADHIALNDPADAILAAEHALGILERHTQIEQANWSRVRGTFSTPACLHCELFSNDGDPLYRDWPCDEVKALAARYGVEVEEVSRS